MMRRWIFPLFFYANILFITSFPDVSADDSIRAAVSILPQKYFVEKIGGNRVDVSVMAPPGADPHTYEPKPRQMMELSEAKIYFAVGVSFETVWLDKIASANPTMRIVHTDHGIEKIPMADSHAHGENHSGVSLRHSRDAADPHVWTAPPLVKVMARNIRAALSDIDPSYGPVYDANYKKFADEIDAIDREFKELFTMDKNGISFMVFHPSWGYFAKSYGLKQIPVEIGGKNPKPGQLRTLIETARSLGIKIIFVQPQFSTRSAETLAKAIGGQVVAADPLAYDWAGNLRQQAALFKAALK